MKKTLKAFLIVLSVLLVVCVSVGVWQWENISAVINALRYSQKDISTLMNDNEKIITEALDKYPDITVRDVKEDELSAYEEGKITQNDLVQIVLGNTSLDKAIEEKEDNKKPTASEKPATQSNKPSEPTPKPTQTPAENDTSKDDAKIAALVAKIYVYKSTYLSRLNSLMGEAESEFYALPIEKRTTATKQKVISSKLGKAAALETECNANMDSLLAELSNELKAQGKDLSLVSSIKKAYANEKQLKKSYYINQYLN